MNNIPNEKTMNYFTVISKHFGHVTFYATVVRSGLIINKFNVGNKRSK